jgi:hypothetical protein
MPQRVARRSHGSQMHDPPRFNQQGTFSRKAGAFGLRFRLLRSNIYIIYFMRMPKMIQRVSGVWWLEESRYVDKAGIQVMRLLRRQRRLSVATMLDLIPPIRLFLQLAGRRLRLSCRRARLGYRRNEYELELPSSLLYSS